MSQRRSVRLASDGEDSEEMLLRWRLCEKKDGENEKEHFLEEQTHLNNTLMSMLLLPASSTTKCAKNVA